MEKWKANSASHFSTPPTAAASQLTQRPRYTNNLTGTSYRAGQADLRALKIDAILHVQCKHGNRDHKLELLDVGTKPYSAIVRTIESVTAANPNTMGIMRIDLTADVKDVTLPWFKAHTRFRFKRTEREFGELKYGLVGRGELETITAGSRPNVFRIYNKIAEYLVQFRRMKRCSSREAVPPQFEKEFGVKETDILTRVERQCGGSRIPPELCTFASLLHVPAFNPFTPLQILHCGCAELPTPGECDGLEYFTGMGLHAEAQRLGMQDFRKLLNRQTRGNAARTLERYGRFFPVGEQSGISVRGLYEAYRSSTLEQLAG